MRREQLSDIYDQSAKHRNNMYRSAEGESAEGVQLINYVPERPRHPIYPQTNLPISTSSYLVSTTFPSHHVQYGP